MTRFRLDGKTAVVTGASGGIGQEIALAFADAGASVLLHANRNPQKAIATLRTIRENGGDASVLTADLARFERQKPFVDGAFSIFPQIDIWVNAAGVDLMSEPLRQLTFEDRLSYLWAVDVLAAVNMSRIVGKQMADSTGGCILFFGWDGTQRGMKGDTAQCYSIAKGAITSFSHSLAQSLAPKVRVCTISPGWIKTDWGENASEKIQEKAKGDSLSQRWGTPAEIANVALFLASDAASYVNCVNIEANGGFDPKNAFE